MSVRSIFRADVLAPAADYVREAAMFLQVVIAERWLWAYSSAATGAANTGVRP